MEKSGQNYKLFYVSARGPNGEPPLLAETYLFPEEQLLMDRVGCTDAAASLPAGCSAVLVGGRAPGSSGELGPAPALLQARVAEVLLALAPIELRALELRFFAGCTPALARAAAEAGAASLLLVGLSWAEEGAIDALGRGVAAAVDSGALTRLELRGVAEPARVLRAIAMQSSRRASWFATTSKFELAVSGVRRGEEISGVGQWAGQLWAEGRLSKPARIVSAPKAGFE